MAATKIKTIFFATTEHINTNMPAHNANPYKNKSLSLFF